MNGGDKTILNMAWERLIRRICQGVDWELKNKSSDGLAIVTITMLIDSNKKPLIWTSPKVSKIEQVTGSNKEFILDIFTNH